ncbi:MAG: sigma-54 dependent transcriptional regulator [Candidatus Krumholzibacteriota bacterium]|nr:sigma-54 dependent transcriptional regulator [Candidatus Krumholzibacteriota bacterium]
MDANRVMGEIVRRLCVVCGASAALFTISRSVEERKVILFRERYESKDECYGGILLDRGLERNAVQSLLFSASQIGRNIEGKMVSPQKRPFSFSYNPGRFSAVPGLPPRWRVSVRGGAPLVFRGIADDLDVEISLEIGRERRTADKGWENSDHRFCFNLIEKVLPLLHVKDTEANIPFVRTDKKKLFDPPIIGNSEIIRSLKQQIQKIAPSELSVLIEGESGTGKEVIARNIHRLSGRASGPLVTVNCMEVQPSLLRSELFGHARGAFTGAVGERAGLVESAGGGTFFLDEIGEMPANLQAALLRVIQEREIRRVGESGRRKIDVRFIFATNRNLSKLVEEGGFRADLFYRVCGTRIVVPPLRERKEDILPLASYFLSIQAEKENARLSRLSASAANRMLSYNWPGNVRELANEMERASVFNGESRIIPEETLSEKLSVKTADKMSDTCKYAKTLPAAIINLEREMISNILEKFDGNRSKSAEVLGISRQGLLNKIKKYRLM